MFRSCAFCGQPPDCGVNLGPMLGPIRDIKSGSDEDLYVHRLCALWSPKVRAPPHPPAVTAAAGCRCPSLLAEQLNAS